MYFISSLACLAAANGEFDKAARLYGKFNLLCSSVLTGIDPIDEDEVKNYMALFRAALSPEAFAAEVQAGGIMELADAVSLGIG